MIFWASEILPKFAKFSRFLSIFGPPGPKSGKITIFPAISLHMWGKQVKIDDFGGVKNRKNRGGPGFGKFSPLKRPHLHDFESGSEPRFWKNPQNRRFWTPKSSILVIFGPPRGGGPKNGKNCHFLPNFAKNRPPGGGHACTPPFFAKMGGCSGPDFGPRLGIPYGGPKFAWALALAKSGLIGGSPAPHAGGPEPSVSRVPRGLAWPNLSQGL